MYLRQFKFSKLTYSSLPNFLRQRRVVSAIFPDFTVIREAVNGLGFVCEYGDSTVRRKFANHLQNQLGTRADDVLCFIHDQMFHGLKILANTIILSDKIKHTIDVFIVGA